MRSLSTNLAIKAAILRGEEPITLLEIDWPTGTAYYSDKTITFAGQDYQGIVSSIGEINIDAKIDNIGSVTSSSITLLDMSGDLKVLYNTTRLMGSTIRVYQTFASLNLDADRTLLLDGKVSNNIRWSDASRVLSFGIESIESDDNIGYQHYEDGPFWPIVFGDCLRVPAVELNQTYSGSLGEDIAYASNTFQVNGGEEFPQDTSINIIVAADGDDYVEFVGSFNGTTFTPTDKNSPVYTNLPLAERPLSGEDYDNPSVFWLTDASIKLSGMYVYIYDYDLGLEGSNYCIKQEGTKCWFYRGWANNVSTTYFELPTALGPVSITEVCPFPSLRWGSHFFWNWFTVFRGEDPPEAAGGIFRASDWWTFPSGTAVYYESLDVTYIANIAPSTQVVEVMAYRKLDVEDSEYQLVPVPSSYYTLDLSDYDYGEATSLYFSLRLSFRQREGWQDDRIYVSLRSTLPNTAPGAIKHLVETYSSNLTIDTTSFADAITLTNSYPTNFAVLEGPELMGYINDIAHQARCVLIQRGSTLAIRYLSYEYEPTYTYTEEEVNAQSLECGLTNDLDIYTHWEIDWQPDYSQEKIKQYYIRNVDVYGKIVKNEEYFIYNIRSLLKQSVGFWVNRYSYAWRTVSFQTLLNTLAIEGFDTNAINIDLYSLNTLYGEVTGLDMNTLDGLVSVEMIIASKDGTADSADQITEDASYWYGDPADPITNYDEFPDDPLSGRAQVDYDITLFPIDEGSESNEEDAKASMFFTTVPTAVERDVAFDIQIDVFNPEGMQLAFNGYVTINLFSTNDDISLVSNIVYIENGRFTGSLTVTGGTGSDRITLSIAADFNQNGGYSDQILVDLAGEPYFVTLPLILGKNVGFRVYISGGTPNGTASVELITDSNYFLVREDGPTISTIPFDASGNHSTVWKLILPSGTVDSMEYATIKITDDTTGSIIISDTITIGLFAFTNTEQVFSKVQTSDIYNHGGMATSQILELNVRTNNIKYTHSYLYDTVVSTGGGYVPPPGTTGTIEIYKTTSSTYSITFNDTSFEYPDDEPIVLTEPGTYILAYYVEYDSKIYITLQGSHT